MALNITSLSSSTFALSPFLETCLTSTEAEPSPVLGTRLTSTETQASTSKKLRHIIAISFSSSYKQKTTHPFDTEVFNIDTLRQSILSYLTFFQVARFSCVSRSWKALTPQGLQHHHKERLTFSGSKADAFAFRDSMNLPLVDRVLQSAEWDFFFCLAKDKFPRLKNLDLTNQEHAITPLQSSKTPITSLSSLNVSECPGVTTATFHDCRRKFPALKSLNTTGCQGVTESTTIAIATAFPHLTSLTLARCAQSTTTLALSKLAVRCPKITYLDLSECWFLEGALYTLGNYSQLIGLRLRICPELDEDTALNLTQGCSNLTSLEAIGCSNASERVVHLFLTRLPQLRSLNLKGSFEKWESELVPAACPTLGSISLPGCPQIKKHVRVIAEGCPNLTEVNLAFCEDLDEATVRYLLQQCKKLQFLDVTKFMSPRELQPSQIASLRAEFPQLQIKCDPRTEAEITSL